MDNIKIYNEVIDLILDNITKKDLKENLKTSIDLYNWFLDKYSNRVFEFLDKKTNTIKYGYSLNLNENLDLIIKDLEK